VAAGPGGAIAATIAGHISIDDRRASMTGSVNDSESFGCSARRTATSAAAREQLVVRHPVAPCERDRQGLQRERATRPGGRVRGDPPGEVRGDDERARRQRHDDPGTGEHGVGERVIRERPFGRHVAVDDLGHRIGLREVDSLERRDDRGFWRAERRRDRRHPDVVATLGGDLIEVSAEAAERALAARRGVGGIVGVEVGVARPPDRRLETGVAQAVGQLPADRDLDPDDVGACVEGLARRFEGLLDLRVRDRRPDPRAGRIAEHPEQLVTGGPVRIDPFECGHRQAARLLFGQCPPIGLAEELGLHREVDRA
jgi:hypothetical protein